MFRIAIVFIITLIFDVHLQSECIDVFYHLLDTCVSGLSRTEHGLKWLCTIFECVFCATFNDRCFLTSEILSWLPWRRKFFALPKPKS